MKEQCQIWEGMKEQSNGRLPDTCPLQAACNGDGCVASSQKIERPRPPKTHGRSYSNSKDKRQKTDEELSIWLAGSLR